MNTFQSAYQCRSCLGYFDEPETDSDFESYDVADHTEYQAVAVECCPECGSEELDEVILCEACLALGTMRRIHQGWDLCLEHSQQAEKSNELSKVLIEIGLLQGVRT